MFPGTKLALVTEPLSFNDFHMDEGRFKPSLQYRQKLQI